MCIKIIIMMYLKNDNEVLEVKLEIIVEKNIPFIWVYDIDYK